MKIAHAMIVAQVMKSAHDMKAVVQVVKVKKVMSRRF